MPFDSALPAGDGVENLRHPVTDVIPHHIADKQSGQEDTHHRIYQVQPVHTGCIKILRQKMLDVLYQELQQTGRQSRNDTHRKAEYQDEMLVLYLLFAPREETLEKTFLIGHYRIHILIL